MTQDAFFLFAFVAAYFSLGYALMKYSLTSVTVEKKLVPVPIRSRRPGA